jgi:integrase
MAEGQFRVMFATAAMTGVRPGELLALQRGDFDFERNLLTIRRRAWRRKIATPKTKPSQAVLPIPNALAQMVRQHIKTLKSEWLFVTKRGNLFHSDKVVKLRLWPILDKLGIPRCGLHAFRHTHSTILLDIANPKQHQEQMRHADPRVTIGVYSHVNAEARRGVVEKLASILDLNGPKFESIGQVIQ